MTAEQFARSLKTQTSDAAVDGTVQCLAEPPGRKPAPNLVQLSEWYKHLNIDDQTMLRKALKEAAEMAVFEFLCVLDGVSVIEETPEKGDLELYFAKGVERIRLNDPHREELHNLFNALCATDVHVPRPNPSVASYDSGQAQNLKSRMKPGDNLDIHHVPDKFDSLKTIKGYDPRSGSAVAIPKAEHRHIISDRNT